MSMSLGSSFLLLVSFLFLFYGSTIILHSHARCIEKEKQALLDFKLSFVDPTGALSSWSIEHDDCCDWVGVKCNLDPRHVDMLFVSYMGLKSNKLRPSLLELQHLAYLDLSGNQFTMRIPTFIGSLGNLTTLDLSDAGFLGEIPPYLGNLSKLDSLYMEHRSAERGPVRYYPNSLYSNSLQWLSRLSSLEHISLDNINPSNAVDWASALKKLPSVAQFECRSCSLPQPLVSSTSHNVNSSTSPYTLGIAGNNINSLAFVGMMFPSLGGLDATSNQITQSLPEILGYLPPNLTALDLSSNKLNGVISDTHFHKFVILKDLSLSGNNNITFNFSKSWVPPFQLISLDLSSCKVGPNFPNWLLTQECTSYIDLSNSMIFGAIPAAFLEIAIGSVLFNLSHNQISGIVPNSNFSFFPQALNIGVDLSYNAFNGPIPLPLFGASLLFLSNNNFSSFPSFHPQLLRTDRIRVIDLSNNDLTGKLANWLCQFTYLVILNLANNKLSGTLPGGIGSLLSLLALHLSNNLFFGRLPSSMKNCTDLAVLDLANNKLSGVVPSWLGESRPYMSILTLRSNNFSGDLPVSLCHLRSLQIIDISENRISGTIPGCLHNFSSMAIKTYFSAVDDYVDDVIIHDLLHYGTRYKDSETVIWRGALVDLTSRSLDERNVINLSGNLLRGDIPIGVTALKELRSLNLSRNHLNGTIPDKIGQLTSLEVLELSSNRLCGEIPRSLATLTFLGTLNLSNNNLSGRIPTGTQLQGFDPSSFAGNPKLCGKPLPTLCPGDEDDGNKQPLPGKDAHDKDDKSFDIQAFLAALGMGFAVGLLGILGSLQFIRPWRLAFFQLVNAIGDKSHCDDIYISEKGK